MATRRSLLCPPCVSPLLQRACLQPSTLVSACVNLPGWAICTRCSAGVHFPCGSVPYTTDFIAISFMCRSCRGPEDPDPNRKFKATGSTRDRVCGNVVCHKANSSRWVRRPYQGRLQWLCSACGACLDAAKCCPHCMQIYRQGDAENFDDKVDLGHMFLY
jgi:hypothetical protein